jgi:hypothetical protein
VHGKKSQDIVEMLAMRTGLLEAQVAHVLIELRETVRHYAVCGRAVRLNGLGIYAPSVGLDGTITIHHCTDRYLIKELNKQGAFRGEILHRKHIGKKRDDLEMLWNEAHSEDSIDD